MEPVQVKLYGLYPVTRRRYLRQLFITAVLLAVLFGLWYFLPQLQSQSVQGTGSLAHLDWALALLRNLHWIGFGLAALVLLEAVFVLRRFAQREAERAKEPAAPAGP